MSSRALLRPGSPPHPLSPARLPGAGASNPDARRYSLARRNLLPREERLIAVRGRWAHHHLVASDAALDTVLWCPQHPGEAPDTTVAALARRARTSYEISPRTLARLHPGATAPDVLSVVRLPAWDVNRLLGPSSRLLLVADGIEYAGNLGTLVRSVDGAGADGLLLTSGVARVTHPKVFTASRGTVLDTPVVELDSVSDAWVTLREAGFSVVVADPEATTAYAELTYPTGRVAIVVGSEGDGVCSGWRHPDLTRVAIPMRGRADSLNVAVSASILLFDAQQRLRAPDREAADIAVAPTAASSAT